MSRATRAAADDCNAICGARVRCAICVVRGAYVVCVCVCAIARMCGGMRVQDIIYICANVVWATCAIGIIIFAVELGIYSQ